MSSSFLFFFFFLLLDISHFFFIHYYSPLSKSMRSWYGWLVISNWRWPTIQGVCTALEGWPTRAVVVMMMMIMVVMRRIRRRLWPTNQGRGDTIDYLQLRHRHTTHISFFLLLLLFFISFSRHLNLVWAKGLYLRTSFCIYAFNWD